MRVPRPFVVPATAEWPVEMHGVELGKVTMSPVAGPHLWCTTTIARRTLTHALHVYAHAAHTSLLYSVPTQVVDKIRGGAKKFKVRF
jgi:hypothetical protein